MTLVGGGDVVEDGRPFAAAVPNQDAVHPRDRGLRNRVDIQLGQDFPQCELGLVGGSAQIR